jgi:hypothetical protein
MSAGNATSTWSEEVRDRKLLTAFLLEEARADILIKLPDSKVNLTY